MSAIDLALVMAFPRALFRDPLTFQRNICMMTYLVCDVGVYACGGGVSEFHTVCGAYSSKANNAACAYKRVPCVGVSRAGM